MSENAGAPNAAEVDLALRALSPSYDEEHHWVYVRALADAVTRTGAQAPRNIALTGPYGSGKSSVIAGLTQHLATRRAGNARSRQIVSVSLSSLGIRDGESSDDEQVANRIQKEIVKQLLYREPASRMPSSRYRRIQPFRPWPAIGGSVFAAALFAAIVKLIDRPSRLANNGWLLLAAAALIALVLSVGQWRLAGRVWLEKLTAGPATVTLSKPGNSYFDDYLDEIVYFFTASGCRIVVFEDLDRFNNARIFETLRGLNTLLNNARQLRPDKQPVRFVYAVRDSIFDLLDDEPDADYEPPGTSRTKFFDLVVPLVPFITARSSRDLLADTMKDDPDCPSPEVIKLVAGHVTDMRLIHNIHNEFQIFKTRILPKYGGLPGLTADRLFAMIAYKNLYLSDFEKIKSGTSKLNSVYAAYRQLVNGQISSYQRQIDMLHERLEHSTLDADRCTELGNRLAAFFRAAEEPLGQGIPVQERERVRFAGGNTYTLAATTSLEFWTDFTNAGLPVEVLLAGNWRPMQREVLLRVAGSDVASEDLASDAGSKWAAEIAEAENAINSIRWAKMPTIFNQRHLTFDAGSEQTSLRGFAQAEGVPPLALDLLAAGYIDETFALYVEEYYETHVSASARNFIIQTVDRGKQDPEYPFGFPEADVPALITELGPTFVRTPSAHNILIFDYLLRKDPELAATAVEALVDSGEGEIPFLDLYLERGKHPALLIGQLSPIWPHTFTFLSRSDVVYPDLISAALEHSSTRCHYASNEKVRDQLTRYTGEIRALRSDAGDPEHTAHVLDQLGVQVENLDELGEAIRHAIVDLSGYRVTRANVRTALDDATAGLALDTLLTRDGQVYDHVVNNLGDYLKLIDEDPVVEPVSDPKHFVDILQTFDDVPARLVTRFLKRCNQACQVDDLRKIPEKLWRSVVAEHRCAPTVESITPYLDKFELDDALGGLLAASGNLYGAAELPAKERETLALKIVNAHSIPLESLEALIDSLDIDAPLPAQSITRPIGPAVPLLVQVGYIDDGREAWEMVAHEPWSVKDQMVEHSGRFGQYAAELPFTGSEVTHLATDTALSPYVHRVVLQQSGLLLRLSADQATHVAHDAGAQNTEVPFGSLVALTQAGAEPEAIIRLLATRSYNLSEERITDLLNAMPTPYNAIANATDSHPAVVPDTCRAEFEKLRSAGHLRGIEKVRNKPQLRVARLADPS